MAERFACSLPTQDRPVHEQLGLVTDLTVTLKSTWESMEGPFEVDFGIDLGSMWGMFWGSLESIWDQFWCQLCVHAEIRHRFWPETPSAQDFLTPGTDLSASLGPPCRPQVGFMLEAVGRLEASLGVPGPISRPSGASALMTMEK